MKHNRPAVFQDPEACTDYILSRVGKNIVLGLALGLGKPNHLANAIFNRARRDPSIRLKIITAITPEVPGWSSDLERRFLEPILERVFGGYPPLEYALAVRRRDVPENIQVCEFFFRPGAFMNYEHAQLNYISTNYTHAVRDLMDNGINVAAQLVSAERQADGRDRYSYSCNPEVALDLVPAMRQAEREGRPVAIVAQVNRNLPYMYGDSEVEPQEFDAVLDHPDCEFPLFAPPKESVSTQDYMIGLNVGSLIRDGGTLQIGIGSLGDAITYGLIVRHEHNDLYREILQRTGILERFGQSVEKHGGTDPFREGLYGCTEMFVDGYVHLMKHGIIKRKVYDHPAIQRLVNDGRLQEEITGAVLDQLVAAGAISRKLTANDVALLSRFGILDPQWRWDEGELTNGVLRIPADLDDPKARQALEAHALGQRLQNGVAVHGGFFIGPRSFYEALHQMPPEERRLINMKAVSYMNHLYGDEELKVLQRRHARFVNTGLMVTLSGAIVSDGLEDGRVISGVGGQYNFVSQAHALPGGRCIIMIRSTRGSGAHATSNVLFNYGNTTIPRHLRDIVVTEYGIADIRGKTDQEVAAALIQIADSRFQDELVRQAKAAHKLPADYRVPDAFRHNVPERLEAELGSFRQKGLFGPFPFGTDLTDQELILAKALRHLKDATNGNKGKLFQVKPLLASLAPPAAARPYLERLGLDAPRDIREKIMQRLVTHALAATGAI
ncbi:Acetyl-CoA hydrolase/transferase C-terminal domain-containing protein [Desulfacinum hydrothermale DSM 13146]|uniref:Acetyl-CoA hydrolase/transferase C-terminal domain-containing protein n=1 Tax=Desulfacinum hydrothermale DSM 13146 TaxID=1121390 RepID=A0A1W1XGD2_9BACT|nr:acetyl-CoA hydrolase/transferase C-terminal domain-containing protein [Desulfacinum hydrothermale]SMC22887.1 Acetyl-CoA hydrolase/transferase C-terminal domain-containing protein [Desulfacinum hydrothermale DSM 13146]